MEEIIPETQLRNGKQCVGLDVWTYDIKCVIGLFIYQGKYYHISKYPLK